MNTVTSSDGTKIAYDRTGTGPPLVLAGGTFSYRRYPGQVKLAGLLSARFTVYSYDRRGRGDSGDTAPYATGREIEDLAAVIAAAGGHAHVWGLSSGAVLALDAAAAGVPILRLAAQEPPLVVDPGDRRPPADLRQHVTDLIGAGRRGEAVRYFMTDGTGAPTWVPALLRLMPGVWKRLTAVAHTLPYDAQLLDGYQAGRPLPAGQWASATMPALVMCGVEKESPPFLRTPRQPSPRPCPRAGSSSAAASATPRNSTPRPSRPPSPSSSPTTTPPREHEQETTMTDRVHGPAFYFPSIEKKYGRPISYWLDLIGSSGQTKHKALVDWLKADYGLGHGHATALAGHALAQPAAPDRHHGTGPA